MPFESEAERTAEALRRALDEERAARKKAEEQHARLQADLERHKKELDKAERELGRLRPAIRLPLGWFKMPVIAALALLLLSVTILVGAVVRTVQSENRAERLAHERDLLAKAANRETAARRAAETEHGPAVVGCLSACGCPDGQGCVGETCREGVSPAHCCDRPDCPSGADCQHWDGSEATCR